MLSELLNIYEQWGEEKDWGVMWVDVGDSGRS